MAVAVESDEMVFCCAHTQCIPHSLCWFFAVAPASFVLLGLAVSHTSIRLSFCGECYEWLWIWNTGLESLREKGSGELYKQQCANLSFSDTSPIYSCCKLVLQPQNVNLLSKTESICVNNYEWKHEQISLKIFRGNRSYYTPCGVNSQPLDYCQSLLIWGHCVWYWG